MPLYIVGIAIALGFALLLWRQHKTGAGWQREVSFLVDLVALSATALVVGLLVVAQLGSDNDAVPESAAAPDNTSVATSAQEVENEPVKPTPILAEETPTSEEMAEPVTPEAESTPTATATARAKAIATRGPTATATLKPTVTLQPRATRSPTPTPKPTSTLAPTSEIITYTVRSGDTLASIAKKYNLTDEELMDANPDVTANRLSIDQDLIIPTPVSEEDEDEDENEDDSSKSDKQDESDKEDESDEAPTATARIYIVEDGDTLAKIAERFGLTTDAIIEANPNINQNNLKIDQEVAIPRPSGSSQTSPFKYTVSPGDTFAKIAERFDLSAEELTQANPNLTPNRLSVGEEIYIP